MRAIVCKSLTVPDPASLIDADIDRPEPGPRDLLVRTEAVSINPVDIKIRKRSSVGGTPRVLGFDAAGTVADVGSEVKLFKTGDAVFYAGSNMRPGSNAEFQLVDERIVGRKPGSLDFAEAAALPLTALTAWELLFDRIGVKQLPVSDGRSLLIIGGGGGVGSMAIQIASAVTDLTVIASASRRETVEWVTNLGAHYVVDHGKPLAEQLGGIGFPTVDIIVVLAGAKGHMASILDLIAPQGRIGLIQDDSLSAVSSTDLAKLQPKSASLHFEGMFARALFGTADMIRQNEILNAISALVDQGRLRTTLTRRLSPINANNLTEAHRMVEGGQMIGKVVVERWQ